MSWQNLVMYSASLPHYDDEDNKEDEWDERLDANNPDNFGDKDEYV